MPLTTTISATTLAYAPVALGAVSAIEASAATLPGETKAQLAANIVMASAQVGSSVPVPQVQEVSALISLFVGILNATGVFNHGPKVKAPVALPAHVAPTIVIAPLPAAPPVAQSITFPSAS